MSDLHDIRDDLAPGESEEIVLFAERLRDERPLPRPAFRGALGRSLQARSPGLRARIKLLIAAYAACGSLLLLIGAIGATGSVPL